MYNRIDTDNTMEVISICDCEVLSQDNLTMEN